MRWATKTEVREARDWLDEVNNWTDDGSTDALDALNAACDEALAVLHPIQRWWVLTTYSTRHRQAPNTGDSRL